ncbi:hypothetical protein TREMEDRAFT_35273, partial [Tremella mesenterica DSM 1558]|uniref:uncharacterized protein n=1 Tax=Tremella mesenterica (strain ATCC 24925 / CBS 8224 / DSM 1558 / NBRC 9311 / NRRL Y-6157 / RJB 2259-6 / UBC 559-6) TaxID=578456 RepID=UPI00032C8C05
PASDMTPAEPSKTSPEEQRAEADKLVAEGKKAIALRKWEEGVGKYGQALDIMRGLVGEFDPAMAPLLLSYGKALYELAVSTQGALGKEELDKQAVAQMEEESSGNLIISADIEDDQTPVDPIDDDDAPEEEAPQEEGEDLEDDFNAAWDVLDMARTIYEKMVKDSESEDVKLNLAQCYVALGDVSCETENFVQAVQDYTSALNLQTPLLPPFSRVLASVHYQLSSVLEFVPDRRAEALDHVHSALKGFQARQKNETSSKDQNASVEGEISKMSIKELENELKDVVSLIDDLEAKIEELKSAPEPTDFVKESITHLLGGLDSGSLPSSSSSFHEQNEIKVNDLSGLVKKKPPKKNIQSTPMSNSVPSAFPAIISDKAGVEFAAGEVISGREGKNGMTSEVEVKKDGEKEGKVESNEEKVVNGEDEFGEKRKAEQEELVKNKKIKL